jgi:hypothetical protein
MKYRELEDGEKLATRDWVEDKLSDLKVRLRTEELERQGKLLNVAGLIGFGLVWGFVIAEFLFLRK